MMTRTLGVLAVSGGLLAFGLPASGCASGDGTADAREAEVAITHPQVTAALADLFRRDQRARKDMIKAINASPPPPEGDPYHPDVMPAVRAVIAIDDESADYLESVLAAHGWPTFDMVGAEGANAAWLIAQHADQRPALQRRALELMTRAAADGQAEPAKLAYLTDRVLVADGKKQRYGTQFGADAGGVQRPRAWEALTSDEASIDIRRARVGLPPLAYAVREWGRSLGAPASVEPLE